MNEVPLIAFTDYGMKGGKCDHSQTHLHGNGYGSEWAFFFFVGVLSQEAQEHKTMRRWWTQSLGALISLPGSS